MNPISFPSRFWPFLCLLSCLACRPNTQAVEGLGEGLFANLQTKHGDIIIRLTPDKAPLTVANFVGLAEGTIPNQVRQAGEPFFDGLTFHRVENNFVIQGGDPLANGLGGPGYAFRQEVHPDLGHNVPGTVAMANAGPGTNGSQFYITMAPTPALDGGYNVFGYVAKGMETVYQVERNDTIQSIDIIRVGDEAKAFDALKTFESLRPGGPQSPQP